jgi:hypothetical protein
MKKLIIMMIFLMVPIYLYADSFSGTATTTFPIQITGSTNVAWGYCIPNPGSLPMGVGIELPPFFTTTVTFSTMTASCISGESFTFMIEKRSYKSAGAKGTNIFSANVKATPLEFKGGTLINATLAPGESLFLVPIAYVGDSSSLMLKGVYVK